MTVLPKLIREAAEPLTGSPSDYNALLDLVGDAQFVLLGEATHGTHEFYRKRAQITKHLIRERTVKWEVGEVEETFPSGL